MEQVYEEHSGDLILEGAKSYTVVRTDTLSKITRSNYGGRNGYYFPLIMLASQDVVKDPDLIEPGIKLTIPDLQKNLNDPGARQKIKEFLNDIANVYNTKGKAVTRDQLRELAASL
jgi:LysM repeat protein